MTLNIALLTRPGAAAHIQAELARIDGLRLTSVDDPAAFVRAVEDAQVAIVPIYLYDQAVSQALRTAPKLRWLQVLSVGLNRLDDDPLPAHIALTTVGDSMAVAMAEHAMGLLLALSRKLPDVLGAQAAGQWKPAIRPSIRGLAGKTLAIVGYGAVGCEIAVRARAFGMHVIGLRRKPAQDDAAHEIVSIGELDAVLARADAVAITAPLTAATRGLFDAARIARMRRGALLVNVSRGGLVNTDALTQALHSGQLGGAGVDVVDPEPLPPQHPLWSAPNLILTPHIAAADSEGPIAQFVAANVRRFIAGAPLLAQYGKTET